MSQRMRGILLVAFGVLVLSFDALLVRLVGAEVWTVVFWRGLLIALSLGLVRTLTQGPGSWRRAWCAGPPALLASLLFGVDTLLFVTAISYTAVANAVVILSASPLFAALFSAWWLGERLSWRTWAAVLATFLGVLAVLGGSLDGGGWIGDLAALAAAAVLASVLTLLRRHPTVERVPVVAASGLVAVVLVLPWAEPWGLAAESYGWLALMGLVQMPLAMVILAVGPRYLAAPEVSLLMLLETVFGPFWVWLVQGEEPPRATWAGGGVILATLLLYFLSGLRRRRRSATAA